MNRITALLLAACAATASAATGDPLLSMIESGGLLGPNLMRTGPFAEFTTRKTDTDKNPVTYSVPFVTDKQIMNVAADFKLNWTQYQDATWWYRQASLNAGSMNKSSGWKSGRDCASTPDPSTLAKAEPDKIEVKPMNPVTSGVAAQLDWTASNKTPVIKTKDACQGVTVNAQPDEITYLYSLFDFPLFSFPLPLGLNGSTSLPTVIPEPVIAYIVNSEKGSGGSIYRPAILEVYTSGWKSGVEYTNSLPFMWPIPNSFDWMQMSQRLTPQWMKKNAELYAKYQLDSQTSLRKNAPLALDWDNSLVITDGKQSGSTITPFYPVVPKHIEDASKQLLDYASTDPLFLAYLSGQTDPVTSLTEQAKDLQAQNKDPGLARFEAKKAALLPNTLNLQEQHGYVSMFQAWQTLDTPRETRMHTFKAAAFIRTWVEVTFWGFGTGVYYPASVQPFWFDLPAAHTEVFNYPVPTMSLLPIPGSPIQPGTVRVTTPRYHWGTTNVIEGQNVPNVRGTPPEFRIDPKENK